jgi:hypothetical protein
MRPPGLQVESLSFVPIHQGDHIVKNKKQVDINLKGLYILKGYMDGVESAAVDLQEGKVGPQAYKVCMTVATGYVMARAYMQLCGISKHSKGEPISLEKLAACPPDSIKSGAVVAIISNKNNHISTFLEGGKDATKNIKFRLVSKHPCLKQLHGSDPSRQVVTHAIASQSLRCTCMQKQAQDFQAVHPKLYEKVEGTFDALALRDMPVRLWVPAGKDTYQVIGTKQSIVLSLQNCVVRRILVALLASYCSNPLANVQGVYKDAEVFAELETKITWKTLYDFATEGWGSLHKHFCEYRVHGLVRHTPTMLA